MLEETFLIWCQIIGLILFVGGVGGIGYKIYNFKTDDKLFFTIVTIGTTILILTNSYITIINTIKLTKEFL